MMYQMYQAQCDPMAPLRTIARTAGTLKNPVSGDFGDALSASFGTAYELVARGGLTHVRPPFGITSSAVAGGETVAVREERVRVTPFATLSGHFATLLRSTVRTMLPDHDVYITDWHDARDVPLADGAFDVDRYVDHMIGFLEALGPGAHVVAVCQPCVPVLAAVAMMAESGREIEKRMQLTRRGCN